MLTDKRAPLDAPVAFTIKRPSAAPQKADDGALTDPCAGLNFFRPGGKDQLFWCFQVAAGRAADYEPTRARGYQREQHMKAEAVALLRTALDASTPAAMKRLASLEAELTARPFTRGLGLVALGIAHNAHVVYVSGKTCCDIGPLDQPVVALIRRTGGRNSRKHEVCTEPGFEAAAESAKAALWCMESWEKPLRGARCYTVGELRGCVRRAGLALQKPDGRPLRKPELYAALLATADQN